MGYNTEFDGEFTLSKSLDEKRGLDAGEEHRAVEMAVAFATGRFGDGEIRRWKCAGRVMMECMPILPIR